MTNIQKQNEIDENKLIARRREKLQQIRQQGIAFTNNFKREDYTKNLQEKFKNYTKDQLLQSNFFTKVAGRIMLNRGSFIEVQDVTGRIQIYVNRKTLDPDTLSHIKSWDIGDIVGITGFVQKSGKGDLYIDIQSAQLLTKSLRPLPEKHKGLVDTELKYRQRYVDLIMNKNTKEIFIMRSKIIHEIRTYFQEQEYIEVETPMLHSIPGGANAKPFITHHKTLNMDMYLRIAPELHLKRLVVGGLEKVFEINRCFRNEGLSTRHNPEFTTIEFYEAYANYHDMMDHTETLIRRIAKNILGKTIFNSHGKTLNFNNPFPRITLFNSILNFNENIIESDINNIQSATKIAKDLGINVKKNWGLGKLQLEIFEETVEHKLINPIFITQYPTEVSPLARKNDHNKFLSDRFEFFTGGREVANGFSELNDPEDQSKRFLAQVKEKESGDDEAMHYDSDYIKALEYGLPPTAGEGIGIDRLVMLFTNSSSIRDVLLFPQMKQLST